jgi:GNAT superfamily N-acetyltransferase
MWNPEAMDLDHIAIDGLGDADISSCRSLFDVAYGDLHRRYGLPVEDSPDPDWLRPILCHFLETDPDRSLIARRGAEPVAFATAFRRDAYWFLSFLFVLPTLQGQGIGRRLLERLVAQDDDAARATVVESFQPASTGLYASVGMTPRSIKYWISGFSKIDGLPRLADGITRSDSTAQDAEDVDELDRTILGFARPSDHAWWRAAGQPCFVFRRGERLVAYAYVDEGSIGPALAVDEATLCAVVGELVRTADDPAAASVNVCGDSASVLQMLVNAGGRIDDGEPYRFTYCSNDGPLPPSYIHHSDWLP